MLMHVNDFCHVCALVDFVELYPLRKQQTDNIMHMLVLSTIGLFQLYTCYQKNIIRTKGPFNRYEKGIVMEIFVYFKAQN